MVSMSPEHSRSVQMLEYANGIVRDLSGKYYSLHRPLQSIFQMEEVRKIYMVGALVDKPNSGISIDLEAYLLALGTQATFEKYNRFLTVKSVLPNAVIISETGDTVEGREYYPSLPKRGEGLGEMKIPVFKDRDLMSNVTAQLGAIEYLLDHNPVSRNIYPGDGLLSIQLLNGEPQKLGYPRMGVVELSMMDFTNGSYSLISQPGELGRFSKWTDQANNIYGKLLDKARMILNIDN